MAVNPLTQRTRLGILFGYLAILFCASLFVHGSWTPPTSEKGLWFYAGLGALVLGSLLVTPFFTKPVDAISYAVVALIGLLTVNVWFADSSTGFDKFFWSLATFYAGLVIMVSILSIVLKDSSSSFSRNLSNSFFICLSILISKILLSPINSRCTILGVPSLIYSA